MQLNGSSSLCYSLYEYCAKPRSITLAAWEKEPAWLKHMAPFLHLSQVDLCFMVDCTGSMSNWIEAVKNNVKQLRDRLETEYKGCDIRFAFVRYTDYDQPASTRNTWIDFTK